MPHLPKYFFQRSENCATSEKSSHPVAAVDGALQTSYALVVVGEIASEN